MATLFFLFPVKVYQFTQLKTLIVTFSQKTLLKKQKTLIFIISLSAPEISLIFGR